jgi:hypothetical protein
MFFFSKSLKKVLKDRVGGKSHLASPFRTPIPHSKQQFEFILLICGLWLSINDVMQFWNTI